MEIYTFVVICLALVLKTSDAQITAWVEPAGSTKDVDAAASTTIAESLATGTATGVTIKATGTGTPTYAIASQATSGKLTIEASTGVLTLAAGTFDFETEPTYVLTIVATDDNDDTTGTATTTISITDVNEAPEFSASDYTACIVDGSTEGTSVITVSASDQDDGDTITYSIASGDTNDDFAISFGELQVNTGKTLDMSTTSTYTLILHASDDDTSAKLTGTATYTINVKSDCGNGAPALVATSMTILMALVAFLV